MALATNPLRLSIRTFTRVSPFRPRRPAAPRVLPRALSVSARRWARSEEETDAKDGVNDSELEFEKDYINPGQVLRDYQRDGRLNADEKAEAEKALSAWGRIPQEEQTRLEKTVLEVRSDMAPLRKIVKSRKTSFWNEDEEDPDLITDEVGEDDFEEDDILSMSHGKLEEHREFREYARLAVWEMPLLAKFAKPFEPPTEKEPLRFRYTTYMGELHPAERKVVVEFCPKDLSLTEAQQLKLLKLAGPRYNPEKEIVRMGCDMFDHQAQNKRYLGDLVEKLIAAAKDPNDMFEDVPLDTRHHTLKTKPTFPKEWRLTEERRKELEDLRRQSFLLDEGKRQNNALIDGVKTIDKALEESSMKEAVAELATHRGPRGPRLPGRR